MVVQYEESGWQLITQRAHGMLAFQIAGMWKHEKAFYRRAEFLLAVAEHDDAEVELDGETLLTDKGGPLNFDMKTFDSVHCETLAEFSLTKSRYIALLTSYHMEFLYEKEAAAGAFLKKQESVRARLLKELSITKTEAEKAYRLLEWCDALSLLLCQNEIPPEGRTVEISAGPDNKHHQLHAIGKGILSVTPWPFVEKDFDLSVEYRSINQLTFASSAELRKQFYEAAVSEHHWRFKMS